MVQAAPSDGIVDRINRPLPRGSHSDPFVCSSGRKAEFSDCGANHGADLSCWCYSGVMDLVAA